MLKPKSSENIVDGIIGFCQGGIRGPFVKFMMSAMAAVK